MNEDGFQEAQDLNGQLNQDQPTIENQYDFEVEDWSGGDEEESLADVSDKYGFQVENWEDDEYTAPMEIPNTVYDKKNMRDFVATLNGELGQLPNKISEDLQKLPGKVLDLPLAAMSGIAQHGVKPIVDAVTSLSYGLTNVAAKGKFEMPTAEETQEDITVLPKSLVGYEPETTAGKIIKPVAGIGYGVAATTTGLGAAGITGKAGVLTNATIKGISKSKEGIAVGKVLAPIVNGLASDSLLFWQDEGNLSTYLKDKTNNPTVKKLFDYLAVDGDDSIAERAAKQALEGLFVTGVAHGVLNIFKNVKAAGKYQKGIEEVQNITKEKIEQSVISDKLQSAVSDGNKTTGFKKPEKLAPDA